MKTCDRMDALGSRHLLSCIWDGCCRTNLAALTTDFRNRPNTISESTVSNTELSEFFGPHRELSEFLSAHLCVNANSPSFSQNSPSLAQSSVSSLFRNSALETVFRLPMIMKLNFLENGPRTCEGLRVLSSGWLHARRENTCRK